MKPAVVRVGHIEIGAGEPVIQSMATARPEDLEAAWSEIRALADAGCELIRFAILSDRSIEALATLKERARKEGLRIALVADVHFIPRLAERACGIVEKVRINPGTFARTSEEASRRFAALAARLAETKTALRIGVNQGSLPRYMIERWGAGARAMVETALEYMDLCVSARCAAAVISLKASDPVIALEANLRLLEAMEAKGQRWPLHLGVTEAGSGRDAILKSIAGIGPLLAAGAGETLRVSLTGPPQEEIPVARGILQAAARMRQRGPLPLSSLLQEDTRAGAAAPPRVEVRISEGTRGAAVESLFSEAEQSRRVESLIVPASAPPALKDLSIHLCRRRGIPFWLEADPPAGGALPDPAGADGLVLRIDSSSSPSQAELRQVIRRAGSLPLRLRFARAVPSRGVLADLPRGTHIQGIIAPARAATELGHLGIPVFASLEGDPWEDAIYVAAPLMARSLDGLLVPAAWPPPPTVPDEPGPAGETLGSQDPLVASYSGPRASLEFAYDLLQATGRRKSRLEIVSCPGCGRLEYDPQPLIRRLRERLSGLAGATVAVMGCAVNGPGEMGSADAGVVGTSSGKVDLYIQGSRVARGLSIDEAERMLEEYLRSLRPGAD